MLTLVALPAGHTGAAPASDRGTLLPDVVPAGRGRKVCVTAAQLECEFTLHLDIMASDDHGMKSLKQPALT